MEKNNQSLILGIVVIGAVLIIALALIFTRSDETATETAGTNDTSENQENASTEENGEDGQQPQPAPDPQPTPQPDPDPQPTPDPDPQTGILPSNWNQLTSREKTDLNPFDCDHETQWVSSEDGSCIEKVDKGEEEDPRLEPLPRLDSFFQFAGEDQIYTLVCYYYNIAPAIGEDCKMEIPMHSISQLSISANTITDPLPYPLYLDHLSTGWECVFIPAGLFSLTVENGQTYASPPTNLDATCFGEIHQNTGVCFNTYVLPDCRSIESGLSWDWLVDFAVLAEGYPLEGAKARLSSEYLPGGININVEWVQRFRQYPDCEICG